MDTVTAILVIVIALLILLLIRSPVLEEEELESDPLRDDTREQRIVRWVAALAGSDDERAEAERCLLSMGSPVIPLLLTQLEQSEGQPLALEPVQQLTLERLVSDFGPQAALSMRRHLRRVHRASPAFPAMLRILQGIGPGHTELARSGDIPFSLLAPLLSRLSTLEETLSKLDSHNEGLELMAIAALPRLDADRALAARRCEDNPAFAACLLEVLERWALPEWKDFVEAHGGSGAWPPLEASHAMCPQVEEVLSAERVPEILSTLSQAELEEPSAILLELATRLDDPRVQERFIRHAQSDHGGGALAFRELARNQVQGLQPLLNHLLQSPALSPADMLHLKAAVSLWPEPCLQALSMALRSETPRMVTRASEVLATLPLEQHLRIFLKAFGRHRYSPLEPYLAAPILCRWQSLEPHVIEALEDSDREVQVAAIELLGFYGNAEHVSVLMAQWGRVQHLDDVLLNAVELIGPEAAEGFSAAIAAHRSENVLLTRRQEILRHLTALEEDKGPSALIE